MLMMITSHLMSDYHSTHWIQSCGKQLLRKLSPWNLFEDKRSLCKTLDGTTVWNFR